MSFTVAEGCGWGERNKIEWKFFSSIAQTTLQRKPALIFLPCHSYVCAALLTWASLIPLWNIFYCFSRQTISALDRMSREGRKQFAFTSRSLAGGTIPTALKSYIFFAIMNSFSRKAFIALLFVVSCWDIYWINKRSVEINGQLNPQIIQRHYMHRYWIPACKLFCTLGWKTTKVEYRLSQGSTQAKGKILGKTIINTGSVFQACN